MLIPIELPCESIYAMELPCAAFSLESTANLSDCVGIIGYANILAELHTVKNAIPAADGRNIRLLEFPNGNFTTASAKTVVSIGTHQGEDAGIHIATVIAVTIDDKSEKHASNL